MLPLDRNENFPLNNFKCSFHVICWFIHPDPIFVCLLAYLYSSLSASVSLTLQMFSDVSFLSVDGRAISVLGSDPVPDYSDMYSIFATNSGGLAYRNPRKGSLLIQAICHVFSNHAYQDDIEELVRKVFGCLGVRLSSKLKKMQKYLETVCSCSTKPERIDKHSLHMSYLYIVI